MTQGFNIYSGNPGDANITIMSVDFETTALTAFGGPISPVATPPGLTDIAMDFGDLYVFATFDDFELPQLILYKSQPTETLLQVDSLPISEGIHYIEVDADDG